MHITCCVGLVSSLFRGQCCISVPMATPNSLHISTLELRFFSHRWPRFKCYLTDRLFLVALTLWEVFCFVFFKVHLIWAAKGRGVFFFEALILGSTDNFFKKIAQKKNECWDDSFSVWKRQICWNHEFHILCVKKKQNRGGLKVTCFGVLFFLYIEICRLDDQICMVMAWKNYDVRGSSTILYLCLLFLFLLHAALVWRMGNCIPLFEDTVHS